MRTLLASLLLLMPVFGQTDWRPLMDGKSLTGWKETEFTGHGAVKIADGGVIMEPGGPMTGITWAGGEFPKNHYEIRFEAARLKGNDFFASLTFPYNDSFATLVTGGWGGDIVGISSIDGWDASDNETRTYFTFEPNRWYAFRLRVTPDRMQVWIDDQSVVNVEIRGRAISLRRGDIKLSTPLGFTSYNTMGGIRKAEYRTLPKANR